MTLSKDKHEEIFNRAVKLLSDFANDSISIEQSKNKNFEAYKESTENLLILIIEGLTSIEIKKEDKQK